MSAGLWPALMTAGVSPAEENVRSNLVHLAVILGGLVIVLLVSRKPALQTVAFCIVLFVCGWLIFFIFSFVVNFYPHPYLHLAIALMLPLGYLMNRFLIT
jgi:hypothetical protein